jgi:hypothetical protein
MLNTNEIIGKKVNLLEKGENDGFCFWKMSDRAGVVVKVIDYDEVQDDWCRHFIVRFKDGTTEEIREAECVFSPDKTKNLTDMLYNYRKDNGVYANVYWNDDECVKVKIEWGDWKHDHRWCCDLMGYIGWDAGDCIVTDENGSDCYSAMHYFYKNA